MLQQTEDQPESKLRRSRRAADLEMIFLQQDDREINQVQWSAAFAFASCRPVQSTHVESLSQLD